MMGREVSVPEDAESARIDRRPDGVYTVVEFYNAEEELIKTVELALGDEEE